MQKYPEINRNKYIDLTGNNAEKRMYFKVVESRQK